MYNDIIEKLQKKAYRLTHIRQKIITLLANNKDQHISINDIIEKLKVENANINIMSVYNTIDLLLKEDVIDAKVAINKQVFYELSADIVHLICSFCHEISHISKIDSKRLKILNSEKLMMTIKKQTNFHINHFNLEIHGLCDKCHNKN